MTDVDLLFSGLLGIPYKWGGKTPMGGLDCSGFVSIILKANGDLSYLATLNSQDIHNHLRYSLKWKNVSYTEAKEGDICFYGSSEKDIHHVVWCLGDNTMIGSCGGNQTTLTMEVSVRQEAYVKILPLDYRRDFAAVLTRP